MLLLLRSLSYGQQLLAVSGQLTTSIPFIEGLDKTAARYESAAAPDPAVAQRGGGDSSERS